MDRKIKEEQDDNKHNHNIVMVIGERNKSVRIEINDEQVGQVNVFKYFRVLVG